MVIPAYLKAIRGEVTLMSGGQIQRTEAALIVQTQQSCVVRWEFVRRLSVAIRVSVNGSPIEASLRSLFFVGERVAGA